MPDTPTATYYPSYPLPAMVMPGGFVAGAYQPPTAPSIIVIVTFGEPLTEAQVQQAAGATRCTGALRMHYPTWEQFATAHGLDPA